MQKSHLVGWNTNDQKLPLQLTHARDTTHSVQNLVVLVQIFDKRHVCSHRFCRLESAESNWNLGYPLIMSLCRASWSDISSVVLCVITLNV